MFYHSLVIIRHPLLGRLVAFAWLSPPPSLMDHTLLLSGHYLFVNIILSLILLANYLSEIFSHQAISQPFAKVVAKYIVAALSCKTATAINSIFDGLFIIHPLPR